uniref:Gustatory receptor n=1 Tax=Anopheles dirus TaxID=7168 RepID=A0A182NR12_9DIPT
MCSPNKTPRHIYDVLQPLLKFSKVCGLSIFHIVGEPPYVQIIVTPGDYAALAVNVTLNCLCVYLNIFNGRMSRLTGSAVMDAGMGFLFPFGAIIMIVLAIDNFLRRHSTCAIIAELFQVDRSLQRKNLKLDHRQQYLMLFRSLMVLVTLVMIGTTFSLLMAIVSRFSLISHAINAYSYLLTGIQFMIVNFHFVSAARLVTYRLEMIKQGLRHSMEAGSWWIDRKHRWGRKVDPIDVIGELGNDYAALLHIVERVNRIYSNQIIFLVTGVGMFSIFVIYSASYSYYLGKTDEVRLTGILLTAWVFYVIMMGLIFSSGMKVDDASRDIVYVLSKAVQREGDLAIRRKLLSLSQQILFRQPTMRSLFYAFNWKTAFNMCGFVVTYLVILIQFADISDS